MKKLFAALIMTTLALVGLFLVLLALEVALMAWPAVGWFILAICVLYIFFVMWLQLEDR